MTSAQQKALYIDRPGGDFVLRDKDIPQPGPGEVQVRIIATALNQDWKVKKFKPSFITHYPFLLGGDSAGIIEEVGEGVTTFAKGDRVIHEASWSDRHASYQQITVAAAELVAKLPDNISFEQAASIPLALATAVIGLYGDLDETGVAKKLQPPPWEAGGEGAYKGKSVTVLGGSSSVGQFAIQLLRLSGFSKIIATASLHNAELLKSLGATHIIDRHADLVLETKKVLGGDSLDVVYDTIGTKGVQTQALELLAPGGLFVAAALLEVDKAAHPDKHLVTLYADFRLPQHWALGRSLMSKLHDLLASGTIKPNRIEVLPNGLAGVVDGLKRLENNEVSGKKLIVRPGETTV